MLCVAEKMIERIMEEIYGGVYGPHMNGIILARKILRLGYYWITMEMDYASYVKKCESA